MATVTVRAIPAAGFYRCGMKFTKEPKTLVEGTDITPAQLKILRAEPKLVVENVADVPEDPTAKELIESIKTMDNIKALGEMFKDEKRTTVINALKARVKELKAAQK